LISVGWHRAQLAASVALIANLIVFQMHALSPPETTPACAYKTPILCAELPEDDRALSRVLGAPPNKPQTWALNIAIDMPYLFAYAVLLCGIVRVRRPLTRGAVIATYAFVAGAGCDVIENLGILHALGGGEPNALWVRSAALAKFALLNLGGVVAALVAARTAEHRGLRIAWRGVIALNLVALMALPFIAYRELALIASVLTCLLATIEATIRTATYRNLR
jgi:hypothetical protein